MRDRKQIRVYVDVDQWTGLKPDTPETHTDTLQRLLAELTQLRHLVGQLADQDVVQLSTLVATLTQIHTNPLIALGMCLERYQQTEFQPSGHTSRSTIAVAVPENLLAERSRSQPTYKSPPSTPLRGQLPIATADDFIDNSGEF